MRGMFAVGLSSAWLSNSIVEHTSKVESTSLLVEGSGCPTASDRTSEFRPQTGGARR